MNINFEIMQGKTLSMARCLSVSSDSWQDTYFPAKMIKQPLTTASHRPEQSDSLSTHEQYQKLARMYQKENDQIQHRNGELLETVRELKQKQAFLLEEIAVLELYYRKILNSKKKQPFKEINNKQNMNANQIISHNRISINSQVQTYNEEVELPIRDHRLRDFNQEFCKLVEESIAEKDPHKRKTLRKELAKLAAEMKKMRNDNYAINFQFANQKNKETLPSTNKTLAPYLQDLSFKNLQKTKLVHSKSGKLRQMEGTVLKR